MIGKMNRRVIVKSWGSVQDEGGGVIEVQTNSFTVWANIEDRSGSILTTNNTIDWSYDYKVTMRYQERIKSNFTIDYDDKRFLINSLSIKNEGNKRLLVARCSTIDKTADNNYLSSKVKVLNYTGIGGEFEFNDPLLIGKELIGVFKDGVEFKVITTGLPDPNLKKVLFNKIEGSLLFAVEFSPEENCTVQYQDL